MDEATYERLNEERTDLIREIVVAVVAQVLPEVRQAVAGDYVGQITSIVNQRFDELDKAQEERHNQFVEQNEARFAVVATKEELSGVVKSGAENTARLDKLEASTAAQLHELDKRLAKVEDVQKKQSDNIQTMTQNTESIRQSVQVMERTTLEEIERDRKRQAEIDRRFADNEREIGGVKDAQKADEKALREAQEDILATRAEMNDNKSLTAIQTDKALTRLVALSDKVSTLENVQQQTQTHYIALEARQEKSELELAQYGALYRVIHWLAEKHPKVGGALLGAFFLTQILALVCLFVIARNGIITPR